MLHLLQSHSTKLLQLWRWNTRIQRTSDVSIKPGFTSSASLGMSEGINEWRMTKISDKKFRESKAVVHVMMWPLLWIALFKKINNRAESNLVLTFMLENRSWVVTQTCNYYLLSLIHNLPILHNTIGLWTVIDWQSQSLGKVMSLPSSHFPLLKCQFMLKWGHYFYFGNNFTQK